MSIETRLDDLLDELKTEIPLLAKIAIGDFVQQANVDAQIFIDEQKARLQKWAKAYAQGLIDKAALDILMDDLKALAVLRGLKSVGLSQQKLERFRVGLINLIINAIFKAVL